MNKFARFLSPILVIGICLAALTLLWLELRHVHLHDIRHSFGQIPRWRLLAAAGLTAVNYFLLVGYDWIAVRSTGRELSLGKTALASFCGFATSYNFGTLPGGGSVRYRLYSAWGFSNLQIAQIMIMIGITFWIGVLATAGVVLAAAPIPWSGTLSPFVQSTRPIGFVLIGISAVYLALAAWPKRAIRIRGNQIRLPDLRTSLVQMLLAAVDFLIAATCMYVLVVNLVSLSYWQFVGVLLLAMVVSVVSHVPGGVGVFELVIIKATGDSASPGLLGALLAFRIIYYWLPLAATTLLLVGHELLLQRVRVGRWWKAASPWEAAIAPQLLAMGTFAGGVALLLSGATPVLHAKLRTLEISLPLPILEASHFLGSIAGAGMLLLGFGLQRRLDSAWWLAVLLTIVGGIASLLKGLGFAEAIFLSVILVGLLANRKQFYRRGSLLHGRFTPGWVVAILLTIGCTVWLGLFAHKHVEYSADLWWEFAFRGDAPRFLRGSVGAVVVLGLFALRKLMRPPRVKPVLPTVPELDIAAAIASKSDRSSANLVLLGDKSLLFNEDRSGFVMYRVQGRTWVALGDPICQRSARTDLAWSFRELVDRYDGWTVFYQVSDDGLPVYLDLGLKLRKIGEEARVPLATFSLDGPARKGLRQTFHRARREHCQFDIVPCQQIPELLPKLHGISDAWLAEKNATEKGFSLGFFSEGYLKRFPCAIVRRQEQPIAFASMWCGENREEMSIDLMRYVPGSPPGAMEYLLIELMLWGKQNGYRWFNLGMAPLSGTEDRKLAPLWNRATRFAYLHGGHFYSFEGLRRYKDKFDPIWSPRYLASPAGWTLPWVVADITRLIGV